jgi:hypothetical protein
MIWMVSQSERFILFLINAPMIIRTGLLPPSQYLLQMRLLFTRSVLSHSMELDSLYHRLEEFSNFSSVEEKISRRNYLA